MPESPSKTLVLASTSPYRAELLKRLYPDFRQSAPDCDETPLSGESPPELVERLSKIKAESLAADFPDSLIIGSDQVADLNGTVLGKPHTSAVAIEQLQSMQGQTVVFRTGLALHDVASGNSLVERVDVETVFRALTTAEIERYVEQEQPLNCAGSFRSEGLGVSLLRSMNCEDPTAVIGLPLIRLAHLLRQAGLAVP